MVVIDARLPAAPPVHRVAFMRHHWQISRKTVNIGQQLRLVRRTELNRPCSPANAMVCRARFLDDGPA